MSSTFTRENRMPALALAAVVATAMVGLAVSSAAASPGTRAGAGAVDYRPSEWAAAGADGARGETPSLTGGAGAPDDGTGAQLAVGVGLVAVGLLALIVAALAGGGMQRRGGGLPRRRRSRGWRRAVQPPANTPAGS